MNIISQNEFAKVFQENWNEQDTSKSIIKTINHFIPTPVVTVKEEVKKEEDDVNGVKATLAIKNFLSSGIYVQLVLFGEDHRSKKDHDRGNKIIEDMNQYPESLVVFERGMDTFYSTSGKLSKHTVVREDNLYANDLLSCLKAKKRSMVMAGYLVACIARISKPTNVILFYGENHRNILDQYFDYFARHTNANTLLQEKRRYYVVRSLGL